MRRKRRHELRRATRRFLERPGAGVHHVTDPAEVGPALRALFALHKQRFAALGSTSGFEGAGREAFHHALAPALLAAGQLFLVRLRAGGTDKAIYYGFRSGGRLMHYQSGIDGSEAGTSPGTILRALVLERDVFDAGLEVFDFLDGDEAYKLDWATDRVRLFDVVVRRRTLEGRLRALAGGAMQLAKGEVRRRRARANGSS